MLKTAAVKHFGSQSAVARALGIQKGAVSKWRTHVPPLQASRLHQLTRGTLRYNPTDYVDWYTRNRAEHQKAAV